MSKIRLISNHTLLNISQVLNQQSFYNFIPNQLGNSAILSKDKDIKVIWCNGVQSNFLRQINTKVNLFVLQSWHKYVCSWTCAETGAFRCQ